MLGEHYSSYRTQPTPFTLSDDQFRLVELSKHATAIKEDDIQWIESDPEARMPEKLSLPLRPASWGYILMAVDGGVVPTPKNYLLPRPRMGWIGAYDPSVAPSNPLSALRYGHFYEIARMRAIIRHEEGSGLFKRKDTTQTFFDLFFTPLTARGRVPMRFDDVQGGELTAVCTWSFHYALSWQAARVRMKVRAKNPGSDGHFQETIRKEIKAQWKSAGLSPATLTELLVVAYKESKFLQFETKKTREERDGLPRKSPTDNDWGVYQLNTLPFKDSAADGYRPLIRKETGGTAWPPTRRQLWDYRANIACGIKLYRWHSERARYWLEHLFSTYQKKGAIPFTPRQRRLERLQRYKGGKYWLRWESGAWQPVPLKSRKYADELIRYADGLEKTPPDDPPTAWNFT
jgi:hypothetical protein